MVNAKKTLILLLVLIVVVSLSGCTEFFESLFGSQPSGWTEYYSNNVIDIEEYSVSSLKPYPESSTTIKFYIRNNGQYSVTDVEVNFFNIQDFPQDKWELDCDGIEPINDHTCRYPTMEKYDEKRVTLSLTTPDREKITKPTGLRVDYYVSYKYFGTRLALIPLIDETTVIRPRSSFTQTEHTYSPIQIGFEPPVGDVKIVDEREIKEHWGARDRPFEVKMNFKHVGSSSIGTISELKLESGAVDLTLSGLEKDEYLACDFDNTLSSNKEVRIPGTLICHFQATDTSQPETTGTISARFDYTYKFFRSQEFEVQPFLV